MKKQIYYLIYFIFNFLFNDQNEEKYLKLER